MKELEFIEIIKRRLSKNSYIGDDCAYLKDIGIVVTQDSLVEDIHFSLKNATPYGLGYKAIIVNLSDIFASGAIPEYLTVSLSLPQSCDENFVKEFYRACDDLSKEFGFEIVGGDITGSDKVYISVCAIGLTKGRNIASRKNAKLGDYVVVTGCHGSSAAGLWLLQNQNENYPDLINAHLLPSIKSDFAKEISTKITRDYAMMDTSDGLVDALFKIAQASGVLMRIDFDKIPYDKEIEKVAMLADLQFEDWILYGGEDYKLVACVNQEDLDKLSDYTIIGEVKHKEESHFVEIVFNDKIEKISDLEKTYNHFKGAKWE